MFVAGDITWALQRYACKEESGELTGVRAARLHQVVSTTRNNDTGTTSTSVTYKVCQLQRLARLITCLSYLPVM